jgi:hypothetical protein
MNNNLQELILEEAFATIFTSEPQSDLSYFEILKSVDSAQNKFEDYKLYPCFEYAGNDDESLVSDIRGVEELLQDFADRITTKQSNYKLEIVITEGHLEDFKNVVYSNTNMRWKEPLNGVGLIDVEFISGEESFQRGQ